MKTVLSIAGSDSSGGAGIQADIKTMTANGVYAMTAITAMTAQNTMGVISVQNSTPEFLQDQLDAVFTDIPPDAVKLGMIPSPELCAVIAYSLEKYNAKNIVADPLMVATSGSSLSSNETVRIMKKKIFPLAAVITPNIPEAEALTGDNITSIEDMKQAAIRLNREYGCAVLIKGGHSLEDANDILCENGEIKQFKGERINNSNTHGTGCTLSSAIASNLAKGCCLSDSILKAKEYISDCLRANLNLGHGSGPLNHMSDLNSKYI